MEFSDADLAAPIVKNGIKSVIYGKKVRKEACKGEGNAFQPDVALKPQLVAHLIVNKSNSMDSQPRHDRVIIHIDVDHFYSQVEEVLNPELQKVPVGIQQKSCLVTCNYIAREFGVTKLMSLQEAKNKCPHLVVVNGEDLTNYRKFSNSIFEVLHKFTNQVEKLGFDENYLDVTSIIEKRLEELGSQPEDALMVDGYVHPSEASLSSCNCGCAQKLILGSQLAKELRDEIFKQLKLTTCAGIAHNKLLAKLIGSQNKPNKQTVLAPLAASTFLAELKDLRSITGIGSKTAASIEETGISTIEELQHCDIDKLTKKFGYDMAQRLKAQSLGEDFSVLRPTGKQKSIGLEDSCSAISIRGDVEEKFRHLLMRLILQISEEDRIPVNIKLTIRKWDASKKTSHRECKQSNILPSLFKNVAGKTIFADGAQEKLLKTIMTLFDRMIDMKVPFNITLLGLCFAKFQERKKGSGSIANFLMKKSDVEVQSITNLSNESITSFNSLNDSFRTKTSSPIGMDFETMSNNSVASLSGSESELEPSPKKKKLNVLMAARRRCLSSSNDDIASPSKLKVSELRLSSKEIDNNNEPTSFFARNSTVFSPLASTSQPQTSTPVSLISKKIVSPLCFSNRSEELFRPVASCSTSSSATTGESELPLNVDPSVFKELPIDMQKELIESWQKPNGVIQIPNGPPVATGKFTSGKSFKTNTGKTNKKNTLHKYFIKNS